MAVRPCRHGKAGRRDAVHGDRDDPRRHEGQRREMADVPFGLSFAPGEKI